LDGGRLIPDNPPHENYFTIDGQGYNRQKISLIPFKYNSFETPLVKSIKSLKDGLDLILSDFQNAMEEDPRNTILVLVNYDGENLVDIRYNLAQFGSVYVMTIDGSAGGV
jgi:hypothetical protein